MIFYKRYIDEKEDRWFEISEERARMYLAKVYKDTDLVVEELGKGHIVRTQFALYRAGEKGEENGEEEGEEE